ncbi:MAG TPA: anthranilate synthase component I [Candidatus Dormibacteraeota bacterium]
MAAPAAPRPSLDAVRALAREHELVPVVAELLADCDTPVSAFLRLGVARGAFLLESVEGGERLARYSFIGAEPMATLTLNRGVATTAHADGGAFDRPYTDPLAVLEEEVSRWRVAPLEAFDAPLLGGAVGFLSYEAATCFERVPVAAADPLRIPHGWFALVDTLIVFDHVSHRMVLVTHARCPPGADVDEAYAGAVARLDDLRARLRRPLPPPLPSAAVRLTDVSLPQAAANLSREDFMAAVRRCREHILAGDIYQVQIGRRFELPLRAGAFDVYRALRSLNPSPYMFFLDTPAAQVVGASPEMLVRVIGRHVDYHPIAGTRRRGATPERDAALEQELRTSEKERAEHLMLVDLGRNDLGRVCRIGSVRVEEMMGVERYSHVMHLVSSLSGELAEGCTAVDAWRACFPAGTVTGAPKLRAMEIIAGLEPQARGVYAGAAGYLGFGGNLDTAIALRTLLVKGDVAYAQASAGIVADSTEAEEALEIDNKVAALLLAVERANAGLEW